MVADGAEAGDVVVGGLVEGPGECRVAVVGNPNVGKTTLFNRLAGRRHRTANFPGTTQEAHLGEMRVGGGGVVVRLIDLPGAYALRIGQPEAEVCRAVLEGSLAPSGHGAGVPDGLLVVADALNLRRNLRLVAEGLAEGLPAVVAVTMNDLAVRRGVSIDGERLSSALGCPVVLVSGKTGEGVEALRSAVSGLAGGSRAEAGVLRAVESGVDAVEAWAEVVYAEVASGGEGEGESSLTDRLDLAFTHPVLGFATFLAVMGGLFYSVFALAATPMGWIEWVFGVLGEWLRSALPGGLISDMVVDGAVAGVGATLVFLPQICLLFFLIALLEGTGYLARAAFVMDRLLRPFGLSGHAFVPLLSSHACALPGIMSTRTIPDRRDRLAAILSAPFMSCTARIPVYVLLTVLLFPGSPAVQAVAFAGCYAVGVVAGLLSSLVARRTVLRGRSRPMALELPSYKVPSLGSALGVAAERGWVFVRKAGVVILGISVVLWFLGEFPRAGAPEAAVELREEAAVVGGGGLGGEEEAAALRAEASRLEASHAARSSFLGMAGEFVRPVFEPLGFDRQLTVGVLASFAAREVFVSTMAVQVVGTEEVDGGEGSGGGGLFEELASARRDDGTALFDGPTSWALLVYYILAMQCLPTLAVTARESGSWKWAGLQLGWMQVVAYAGAFVAYRAAALLGAG